MAKITFRLTPGETLDFSLRAEVTRLGRHASNEIAINNTWISSFHAEFRREGQRVTLHDLHSSNGTSINGGAVSSQELKHGDRISFGQLEAVYDAEAPAPSVPPQIVPVPVKPAVAPVAVRAMTAPPATIAYDNVRREGELELEALRKKLAEAETAAANALKNRTVEETALAEVKARQTELDGELAGLQSRLDHLRRETEGAEALNAKVADLRQQQAEAERRLDFLNDRLAGMSEAPDPNWGTVHSLARSFIKKLDLIDDLIAHLAGQPEATGTLDQLCVFRAGLLDILKEYSIEAYSLEPGTVIDVAARKRIQIVETLSEGSHDGTRIVRTYRPGYVCRNGDLGISTLLRKADVAVLIPSGMESPSAT